jgi:leucyl-tRNA synthetase
MDDPDWRSENLRDIGLKLESFMNMAKQIIDSKESREPSHLDGWLISRMHDRIIKVSEGLENLKTRAAAENVIYEIPNDIRWYLRRRQDLNRKSALSVLEAWVRLMAPFSPHLSEEVWEQLGKKDLVSTAEWPRPDEFKKNIKAELIEEMVQETIEDVNSIIRVTERSPRRIMLYTAADWKWRSLLMLLDKSQTRSPEIIGVLKELASDPTTRDRMKETSKYVQTVSKEISQMAPESREKLLEAGAIDEREALRRAVEFFSRELKAEVQVYREDDASRYDPKGRAQLARPHRPAIYIE